MRSLLVLIVCCLLFISCRKNKSSNELLGEWRCVQMSRIGLPWGPVSRADEVTYTFRSNNTYTLTPPLISSMAACTGNYRIEDGNTLILTSSCQGMPVYGGEYKFTVDGEVLILDHITTSSGVKTKYIRQP